MTARLTTTAALLTTLAVSLAGGAALAQEDPGEGRGAMLLELFDSIDTDADGKLSQAELDAHHAARFAAADTNQDGKLDAAEISAEQLARFSERLEERTARMIENRDANGDGAISVDEIGEGPMQRHFARIDSDNDGMISKAEAEEAGKRMHKRGKHRDGKMGMNN